MKISELGEAARIAIEGLQANKLRSFLTTLGVVIGITFVILMDIRKFCNISKEKKIKLFWKLFNSLSTFT